MRKSIILSILACMMLLAGGSLPAGASVVPDQEYKEISVEGKQTDVEGDWTPSTENNAVQESEITRKMLQAEKARNAAENDAYGGAITIIAMCIVISALVILSLLFLGFGKISAAVHKSRKREAHGVDIHTAESHHEELDSGEVIAAISMALAEHLGQGHDLEDTILTIRRMRKAYSPWNSKIYNMRVLPMANKTRR